MPLSRADSLPAAFGVVASAAMSLQTSDKFLQEIVSTVASSIELADVLPAVVRLMSDASGVHGCFVYLLEDEQPRHARRVAAVRAPGRGRSRFERGESLAWWAVEHDEPAFIRENALADPRVKYVPELEEERYQSLLAVPIVGRSGEAIGAITAHTEAPREFTDGEVDFIVTSASLVASAIENARLYEETRLRVSELEQLTELAEAIASADALDELLRDGRVRRAPAARARRRATCTCSTRPARSSTCGRAIRSRVAHARRSVSPSSAPSWRAAAAARGSRSRSSPRAS